MGPREEISQYFHAEKYRSPNESFEERMYGIANALKDGDDHYHKLKEILLEQRFLPAGRVQASVGSTRSTTPYNCYVSGTIGDSMDEIMDRAKEAAQTMRLGGGIGYDFSTLRPNGARITTLDSKSSGPLSFMDVYNSVCGTVASAGHRRGAQMGVLRVDHPDIEEFIRAKQNSTRLTNFNISVACTDEFMQAVKTDDHFDLKFEGRKWRSVKARTLWDEIMRATWDWAEPGVLFIDTINNYNNLYYVESIAATNPCGEQPLPPYGACLLGSFNLVKYIGVDTNGDRYFRFDDFARDVPVVVRAMDNIIDPALYPLEQQRYEAMSKRRMGLGLTGVANAIEALGCPYGSEGFLRYLRMILSILRDKSYLASTELAEEKGSFKLFNKEKYLEGRYIRTLPASIQSAIETYGIRNSHLTSIAPTGTISLCADNVSSGLEPVFDYNYYRTAITPEGPREFEVWDYGAKYFGTYGRGATEVSAREHVDVLTVASQYIDSACSKTCNVGDKVGWEEFKSLYMDAYDGGAKGCTTFRAAGKRMGILQQKPKETAYANQEDENTEADGAACYYDPSTGQRSCDS